MVATLSGQVPGAPLLWASTPREAEEEARSLGKPILLLWQAGPGAVAFTEAVDRLFSTWPGWTDQVRLGVVTARARAWEGDLPASYPPLPIAQTSVLMLWRPDSGQPPLLWTELPPPLELSRLLAQASGRPLADPYTVDVVGYEWEQGALDRLDEGPYWSSQGPEGVPEWEEEGPLGTVLILRELATGQRAAFPLDGEWSFLFDGEGPSWSEWNPVLVKRR